LRWSARTLEGSPGTCEYPSFARSLDQKIRIGAQKLAEMMKMSGILGFLLLVLLLSPATSEALWPEEKKPATSGEAAKEYAKEASRQTTDAASNVGEALLQPAIIHIN